MKEIEAPQIKKSIEIIKIEEVKEKPKLKTEMDKYGNFSIEFPEGMNTSYSLPFLNESFVNISIIANDNDVQVGSQARNVKLSWGNVSFVDDKLKFKVSFQNPMQISLNEEPDLIKFEA